MRAGWILTATVALLALTSGTATAQGRGHGRGGDKGPPPGQVKKAERQQAQFNDHDREIARNWYIHERRGGEDRDEDRAERGGPPGLERRDLPPGLRDRDRLPPGIERQLRPGWVVDRDDRARLYPVPVVLVRGFAPPPPGFRYFAFGGHIVLVDPGYRVLDVIHLELNLGM